MIGSRPEGRDGSRGDVSDESLSVSRGMKAQGHQVDEWRKGRTEIGISFWWFDGKKSRQSVGHSGDLVEERLREDSHNIKPAEPWSVDVGSSSTKIP